MSTNQITDSDRYFRQKLIWIARQTQADALKEDADANEVLRSIINRLDDLRKEIAAAKVAK